MQTQSTLIAPARPFAAYLRVSSKKQEEGASLEEQERLCREYAAAQGIPWAERYVYRETHSRLDLWERPRLQECLAAIRAGEVGGLLVWKWDRASGDTAHQGFIESLCERAGAQIHSWAEGRLDGEGGDGTTRLLRTVSGLVAQQEVKNLMLRTSTGRHARLTGAKDAPKLLPGKRARYGFMWDDVTNPDPRRRRTRYLANPATAPIVRRLFAEAERGATERGLAVALNAEGVPAPNGTIDTWRPSAIHRILTDPIYTGVVRGWRTVSAKERNKDGLKTRRATPRPVDEQVALPDGLVVQLVEPGTFAAVQARLAGNKKYASRNSKAPFPALLRAGFARCGYCGLAMYVNSSVAEYRCTSPSQGRAQQCHHTISVKRLDAEVWDAIRLLFTHPEWLAIPSAAAVDPLQADVDALEVALAKNGAEMANLVANLKLVRGQAAQLVAVEIEALEDQHDRLQIEQGALLSRLAKRSWRAWFQPGLAERDVAVAVLSRAWSDAGYDVDTLPLGEAIATYRQYERDLLERLGVRVRVWRADHEPRWQIDADVPLKEGVVLRSSGGTEHNSPVTFPLRITDHDWRRAQQGHAA